MDEAIVKYIAAIADFCQLFAVGCAGLALGAIVGAGLRVWVG